MHDMTKPPSFEFLAIYGANIQSQIAFSSQKDAVEYYEANAVGLKPGDSFRVKLLRRGKPWKDSWRTA